MANYLYTHYKGKYRIVANLDEQTNDVPRDDKGAVLDGYDDTYIECASHGQITHYGGSTLEAYSPSIQRGKRIAHELLDEGVEIFNIVETDGEYLFRFKAKDIEAVATKMGARTLGANTSPFSPKRLPKAKYKIPEDSPEWIAYRQIVQQVPKDKLLVLSRIIQTFINKQCQKALPKGTNVKADMRQKQMGRLAKEYIHSLGLWDKFLVYLQAEVATMLKEG